MQATNMHFSSPTPSSDASLGLFGFYLPISQDEFSDTALLYVGPHERAATDLGCVFYANSSLRINSSTWEEFKLAIPREMAKRASVTDAISQHSHIGIVVENPNNGREQHGVKCQLHCVETHIKVAQLLQRICHCNDIFAVILYVGRLTEAKLGNFADLQSLIHISCSGKARFPFHKPIVSPLEFLCAKFE